MIEVRAEENLHHPPGPGTIDQSRIMGRYILPGKIVEPVELDQPSVLKMPLLNGFRMNQLPTQTVPADRRGGSTRLPFLVQDNISHFVTATGVRVFRLIPDSDKVVGMRIAAARWIDADDVVVLIPAKINQPEGGQAHGDSVGALRVRNRTPPLQQLNVSGDAAIGSRAGEIPHFVGGSHLDDRTVKEHTVAVYTIDRPRFEHGVAGISSRLL